MAAAAAHSHQSRRQGEEGGGGGGEGNPPPPPPPPLSPSSSSTARGSSLSLDLLFFLPFTPVRFYLAGDEPYHTPDRRDLRRVVARGFACLLRGGGAAASFPPQKIRSRPRASLGPPPRSPYYRTGISLFPPGDKKERRNSWIIIAWCSFIFIMVEITALPLAPLVTTRSQV